MKRLSKNHLENCKKNGKKFLILIALFLSGIYSTYGQHTDEVDNKINTYVSALTDIGSFSGNVLVMQKGKELFRKSYGIADDDIRLPIGAETKFFIGSNSKTITAIAILLLAEKGQLSLTDYLSKYVTDFSSGDSITIHQLLTHTSGLSFDLPFFLNETTPSVWGNHKTLSEQINLVKEQPLAARPGTKTIYSNNGYRMLAYIIEKVSGKSFGEFIESNIFKPCSMNESGHSNDIPTGIARMATGYFPEGAMGRRASFPMNWSNKIGHASIYTTINDSWKLYKNLFSYKLLSKASVDKMTTLYASTTTNYFGYGLSVWPQKVFGNQVYGFNGRSPGFSAELRYYKEDDLFIAVLSNNYAAPVIKMTSDFAAIALGQPYETFSIGKIVQLDHDILDQLIGDYEGDKDFVMSNAKLKVIRKGNDLIIQWLLSGGRESILLAQSDTSFFDKTFWATLNFEKNEQGKVIGMSYYSRGHKYIAVKK